MSTKSLTINAEQIYKFVSIYQKRDKSKARISPATFCYAISRLTNTEFYPQNHTNNANLKEYVDQITNDILSNPTIDLNGYVLKTSTNSNDSTDKVDPKKDVS